VYYCVGVSNINISVNTSTTNNSILVVWDPASSHYCGKVLYYQIEISSNKHIDISNHIIYVRDLEAMFFDLKKGIEYNVSVIPFNRIGAGLPVTTLTSGLYCILHIFTFIA